MPKDTNKPIIELAQHYASYYVEDYARKVMHNLKGSYKVPKETIDQVISDKLKALSGNQGLLLNNSDTVGRFLFECAEFALENKIDDAASRSVWDEIKTLPSAHHAELNALAYAAADLYRNTMKKTVIGTIARDADTTAKLIAEMANTRTNITQTGGNVHTFNWGILNNGMWLDRALLQARDIINIFKPDATPHLGWIKQAFDRAHGSSQMTSLSSDDRLTAAGDVNLLLSDAGAEKVDELLQAFDQEKLNDVLFRTGKLTQYVIDWEKAQSKTAGVIESVEEMSNLAYLLGALREAVIAQPDDTTISPLVQERVQKAYDTVSMSLVAYEALRETRFSDTLIMNVEGRGDDPTVDVFINGDHINQYYATGGSDDDLVHFGHYLDPRGNAPRPNYGWTQSFVNDRRIQVVGQSMANEVERLEKLRQNDADVIRREAKTITQDLVQSYLTARNIDTIPNALRDRINRFSNDVIKSDSDFKMDEQITGLLTTALGDSFVEQATESFVAYLNSDDTKPYADGVTIVSLAVTDAIDHITYKSE